jgi:hypothetical protein
LSGLRITEVKLNRNDQFGIEVWCPYYTLRNKGSSPTHITNPTLCGFSRCEKPLKVFQQTLKGFSQREGFFEKPLGFFHSVKNPIG